MNNIIEKAISEARQEHSAEGLKTLDGDSVAVEQVILALLFADLWSDEHFQWLAKIERKIDITSGLSTHYSANWLKKTSQSKPISKVSAGILAILLFKNLDKHLHDNTPPQLLLKKANCLLKLTVLYPESLIKPLKEEFYSAISVIGQKLPEPTSKPPLDVKWSKNAGQLKTIPITVLFYEGPIARAYLETIQSLGLAPEKIINLVAGNDVASKKPVGRFLPSGLRMKYAANIQKQKIHFWPKSISSKTPDLKAAIATNVLESFNFSKDAFDGANELKALTDYCSAVEHVIIDDLKDPALVQYLVQETSNVYLFTGGGLVPADVLSIPNKRYLHIHPGFLPIVRGADCLLWSIMFYGHASASCFYMAPGIDTGDIITAEWLPALSIDLNKKSYSPKMLYRAIYSYVDPWVRAAVLRKVLLKHEGFENITIEKQSEEDGWTFHFMAASLQETAFEAFIK